MNKTADTSWKSEVMLLFVVLVWGLNMPILKGALASMHMHVLNVFRYITATLVLGIVYYYRQKRTGQSFFEPLREYGKQIVSLGLLGYVVYQLCFIIGINHTSAGNAALIMASAPLWTAVLGRILRLEHLTRTAWIGLAGILAGAVLIVFEGKSDVQLEDSTIFGNLFMFAAAFSWGVYTALSKPVQRHVSATGLTFFGLLFGFPFLLAVAIPYFDVVVWQDVRWWIWGAILYSGGLSIGLCVVLWHKAVHDVGASHTAGFANLVPIVALISSVFLLGETITAIQVAGGIMIIGGLIIMRRVRRSQQTVVTTSSIR